MTASGSAYSLEEQIDQWRNYLRRRQAIQSVDVAELEDHLREQVEVLIHAGLATDEAFLVAVKRLGDLDSLSREFAREQSDRLWKQLVAVGADANEAAATARTEAMMAFGFAVAAGVAVKAPALFGMPLNTNASFYARNASLFTLPLLTAFFAWKRRLDVGTLVRLLLAFAAAGIVANMYPLVSRGSNEVLTAMHLPIALWLAVGIAYAGGRWNQAARRMDFVRFSGELFIYYVLIALGGILLTAFMAAIFEAIGIKIEIFFQTWMLPCGAAGAVIIASWLVEAKQSVIENMAPVLTRLFTPLFAAVLIAFLVTLLWTGRGVVHDRTVIIAFDAILALVLALLLYSVSARDPRAPAGAFDALEVVLVGSALVADVVALWAIAARISEFGFSPNRVAALGGNLILLVNLAWSAVLYLRFLRGRGTFAQLERWQTNYLPVYAMWAAFVVVAFPPLFRYI